MSSIESTPTETVTTSTLQSSSSTDFAPVLKHPFPDHGKDEAPCIICCKMSKNRCQKCHKYYYCCIEHQKLHWTEGFFGLKHKEECKQCGLCTSLNDVDNREQMTIETTALSFYQKGLHMPDEATEEEKDILLINHTLSALARPLMQQGIVAEWMTKEFIVSAVKKVVDEMQSQREISYIELDKDSELEKLMTFTSKNKKEGLVIALKIKPHRCCTEPLCEKKPLHGVLLAREELQKSMNNVAKRKFDIVFYRAGTYSFRGQRSMWMNLVVKT